MMLVVLGTFIFVIFSKSQEIKPTITTYIPPASETSTSNLNNSNININSQTSENYSTTISKNILIFFLIIFALLFIIYISIKITKELKNNQQP